MKFSRKVKTKARVECIKALSFSRNFKESSKFLEALMTNKRIVGISQKVVRFKLTQSSVLNLMGTKFKNGMFLRLYPRM